MDYVEVLANWCVRRGVSIPTYTFSVQGTTCLFMNKEYTVKIRGRQGAQDAAQEAYEHSGVFGKVTQSGFVPEVRRDREVIIDTEYGSPGALVDALRSSPPNVQVSVFTTYNSTFEFPKSPGYSYTTYTTIHPGDEAYVARIEWYIQTRLPVWRRYDTEVHVYSNTPMGEHIKNTLDLADVRVVLM